LPKNAASFARRRLRPEGHRSGFVPEPDHGFRQAVFVARRGQRGGAENRMAAAGRVAAEPARGRYPLEMARREMQRVAVSGAQMCAARSSGPVVTRAVDSPRSRAPDCCASRPP
jgi:hypothetical protein